MSLISPAIPPFATLRLSVKQDSCKNCGYVGYGQPVNRAAIVPARQTVPCAAHDVDRGPGGLEGGRVTFDDSKMSTMAGPGVRVVCLSDHPALFPWVISGRTPTSSRASCPWFSSTTNPTSFDVVAVLLSQFYRSWLWLDRMTRITATGAKRETTTDDPALRHGCSLRLRPQGIVLPARIDYYAEVSSPIQGIFERFTTFNKMPSF